MYDTIHTNIIIIARAKGVASDKVINNYYFKTISRTGIKLNKLALRSC